MNKMAVLWKRLIIVGLVFSIVTATLILFPNEKKTILTFGMFAGSQWDVPNDDCYKIIDEAIEEFEKEHPNVEVQYVSGILKDDYSEWLSQKALKGDMPDVCMVLSQDFDTFSSVGVLKRLDTMIKEDSSFHEENYYRGCYDAGKFEEHQYALPYESVPTFMFVNKTLLEREHIKMPDNNWTWEEFYDICKKVTKDTDGDGKPDQFGAYNYNWLDAVYSNGGKLFNNTGTICHLTQDPIENSILFARDIYQLSGFRNPTSEEFDMGKIAFRPMTFSEFRTYKPYPWKINKYFNFEWDCIRLPSGPDEQNQTKVDNLLMGISNKSNHSEIAWEFLKKLAYDQNTQKKLFQYSQGVSALKAVTNSKQTEEKLEESMGTDTGMKVSLLDEVMEQAAVREKFRGYDTIIEYMDGQILKLMVSEDDVDKMLDQ